MIVVLVMAATLYATGALIGTPVRRRWIAIAGLLVAVVLVQLVLPAGHSLRVATGGDARLWLLVLAASLLVWGYRGLLGMARRRARSAPAAKVGTFSETELGRYARHMMLREIGGPGQKKLKSAKVLVIGAGGLGSPALMYLAAAGVGTIGVVDDDVVEGSNLQRQIIHTDDRIGQDKVQSAALAMRALNPFIEVRPFKLRLTAENAAVLFAEFDLILDGCDNFSTRYMANAEAARLGKPLISAAITQWEGQISLYDPAGGAPCYQCIFPQAPAEGLVPTCAEAGVVSPLPGVVGAMMALEAIKEICGAGEGLRGRMLIYDALYGETRVMRLSRSEDCPVCGG